MRRLARLQQDRLLQVPLQQCCRLSTLVSAVPQLTTLVLQQKDQARRPLQYHLVKSEVARPVLVLTSHLACLSILLFLPECILSLADRLGQTAIVCGTIRMAQ